MSLSSALRDVPVRQLDVDAERGQHVGGAGLGGDTARLPCLATGTPQAATTNAAAVEICRCRGASPPVPHDVDGVRRAL